MVMDLKALHDELHAKINEIDEVLDSQDDQKAAGKRKITNDLIEASKQVWEAVATKLIEQLKAQGTVEDQIGIYYGLTRALTKEFSKPLAEAVEAKVEAIPEVETVKVPDDKLKELSEARSELYKKVKTLVDMNETFGGGEDMVMPRKRTGSRGKRGPRAITAFVWNIDEVEYEKLKDVAEAYDQFEKTADLTKAMREAKIDLKTPPDRIEFTMPDGKILVGVRDPDKAVTEDSDADDDEDDSEVTE